MSNPKSLSYWSNPRDSIASKYKDFPVAYATSGFHAAYEVLRYLNTTMPYLKTCTLLDYGCGTGRVTRPLSFFFKQVVGYDPVSECIQTATSECEPLIIGNLGYTSTFPIEGPLFDFCCSINVLEHLSYEDQCIALINMKKSVKPEGKLVLWYSPKDCGKALEEFFPCQKRTEDKPGIYIDLFRNIW